MSPCRDIPQWSQAAGGVAQTLVVGEDPPQFPIIEVALVEQHADALRLDKRMAPLPTRADTLTKQHRDCRSEARVVAAYNQEV
jgi:hypothetical protein